MTTQFTKRSAAIEFLKHRYVTRDGRERFFFDSCFGVPGHGSAAGLGHALQQKFRLSVLPQQKRAGNGLSRGAIRQDPQSLMDRYLKRLRKDINPYIGTFFAEYV